MLCCDGVLLQNLQNQWSALHTAKVFLKDNMHNIIWNLNHTPQAYPNNNSELKETLYPGGLTPYCMQAATENVSQSCAFQSVLEVASAFLYVKPQR